MVRAWEQREARGRCFELPGNPTALYKTKQSLSIIYHGLTYFILSKECKEVNVYIQII